jgi:hypothetical protein
VFLLVKSAERELLRVLARQVGSYLATFSSDFRTCVDFILTKSCEESQWLKTEDQLYPKFKFLDLFNIPSISSQSPGVQGSQSEVIWQTP